MNEVNIFSAKSDGRVDVARAVGSTATAMFIYDLGPTGAHPRITTSTRRNGCSSSTARSWCAHLTGSTRLGAATSSAFHRVRPERTS